MKGSFSKPTRGHSCEVTIVKLYILPALISQSLADINSNYFRLKSCSKCIKTIFIKRYNTLPISKPTPTLGSYTIFHKISHIYPYPPPLPASFSTYIHISHPTSILTIPHFIDIIVGRWDSSPPFL